MPNSQSKNEIADKNKEDHSPNRLLLKDSLYCKFDISLTIDFICLLLGIFTKPFGIMCENPTK